MASAHFKHLSLAASNLLHLSRALHRNINNAAAFNADAAEWLCELNKANARLRCIAIPQSGLMPVDLKKYLFLLFAAVKPQSIKTNVRAAFGLCRFHRASPALYAQ